MAIVTHMLASTMVNAHMLYKAHTKCSRKDPYFTLIGFIKFVAKSWRTELQVSISGFHRSSEKYDSVFRRTSVHVPGYLQRKTYIDPDDGKEKQLEVRRLCVFCKLYRVPTICVTCNAGICFADNDTTDISTTCWYMHHT